MELYRPPRKNKEQRRIAAGNPSFLFDLFVLIFIYDSFFICGCGSWILKSRTESFGLIVCVCFLPLI